jgi:hypothetical protein
MPRNQGSRSAKRRCVPCPWYSNCGTTKAGREFLDVWEAENVEPVAQSEKSREAERLAPLCRADAIRAGISEGDLEAAAGGDLVAFMREALDAADTRAAN